jgi:hypothetical protein
MDNYIAKTVPRYFPARFAGLLPFIVSFCLEELMLSAYFLHIASIVSSVSLAFGL